MASFPVILASTLLDLESDTSRQNPRWRTGVKVLDRDLPGHLWRGGHLVAIGGIDAREREVEMMGSDEFEQQNTAKALIFQLLTTHLLDHHYHNHINNNTAPSLISPKNPVNETQINPSVFLVSPPNSSTISSVHDTLVSKLNSLSSASVRRDPAQSRSKLTVKEGRQQADSSSTTIATTEQALSLLNHVSLLQYLDLTGLAESISEISSHLHYHYQTHQQQQQQKQKQQPTIILIESLSPTLSQILISNNNKGNGETQTAALLTSLLRSLRQLVRRWSSVMVLLELDVGLENVGAYAAAMDTTTWGTRRTRHGESMDLVGAGGLSSAFADVRGRYLSVGVMMMGDGSERRTGGSSGYARSNEARSRNSRMAIRKILENALDTVVVVHDGFRQDGEGSGAAGTKSIVEVVKDGTGDGLGIWAVWDSDTQGWK